MKRVSQGSGWKRFMALGCSHGNFADPEAIAAVLKFKKDFKPHRVIHLGDFIDLSAFMGGTDGEGEKVRPDLDAGLDFLRDLEPTDVLSGNHEDRLWRDLKSRNELRVLAAETAIEEIETTVLKLHAQLYPYSGVWQRMQIANYMFTHGTVYGENAPRDMAEMYGNVIFAHTHKTGQMTGRRIDCPQGISVGTLTRKGAMDYAKNRRATLSWSQGIVYGEYNDTHLHPILHSQNPDSKWRIS